VSIASDPRRSVENMDQNLLLEFIAYSYGYDCYDFNYRNYGRLQIYVGLLQIYRQFYFVLFLIMSFLYLKVVRRNEMSEFSVYQIS
jgi:hypothetical protein